MGNIIFSRRKNPHKKQCIELNSHPGQDCGPEPEMMEPANAMLDTNGVVMDIATTDETTVAGSTGHTSLDVEELIDDIAGKRALKTLQRSELSSEVPQRGHRWQQI
jgi:hypothetical protein